MEGVGGGLHKQRGRAGMEITAMALMSACPQFKLQSVTLFTS